MASLNNVVNVALIPEGRLVPRDNPNICAVISPELGYLNTEKRVDYFFELSAVGEAFGTQSKMYEFATAFFGVKPNPVNAGGVFVAGYWRAADEDTPATSGKLMGGELNEAAVISTLQNITDGSFEIGVDGAVVDLQGLAFNTSTTLADVVYVIDAALTGATATLDGVGIVITSDTTGASSAVGLAGPFTSGTDLSTILKLGSGTGAVNQIGVDAGTIAAETVVDALAAVKEQAGIRGAVMTQQLSTAEVDTVSSWAQAEDVLVYEVFSSASNLVVDPANPVWNVTLAGRNRFRMIYRKNNDRTSAAAYMARQHTVNFAAENSANTMNLKELGIASDDLTQGEINSCKKVGLDMLVPFGVSAKVLMSGANDFTDNPYNIIAYVNALQVDVFNVLAQTGTKLAQITSDVDKLVDQCEKTTAGFARANVFGAGTWTSPDTFGDLGQFNRAIEAKGYYFLAGKLSDQAQADRVARKAPVIQGAVKNAGAIHSVDIIVNFNL